MLKLVQVGFGPIGQRIVAMAAAREGVRVVAVVDSDPAKCGRDAGALCGLDDLHLPVCGDLGQALAETAADAAVLATVSSLSAALPTLLALVDAGLPVVSTCEQLAYPWAAHAAEAAQLDTACRRRGVACVGTGVNPGFLMDYLPCVLSAVCQDIRAVRVRRIQDAASRRGPFQEKIGAGLTVAEFRERAARGSFGHVGLAESVHFIAAAVGWCLDEVCEDMRPVTASAAVTAGALFIRKGDVCGVEQSAVGRCGGVALVEMQFRAAVGEMTPLDAVHIVGDPEFTAEIRGGIHGDTASCAIALNAARALQTAAPGLRTMLDLPVPAWFRSGAAAGARNP